MTGKITDEKGAERNLLSVNQLRRLKKCNEDGLTECLMILGRMHPVIAYLPDISSYYGVEPTEYLEIPYRKDDKENEEIDFRMVILKRKDKRIERLLNSDILV